MPILANNTAYVVNTTGINLVFFCINIAFAISNQVCYRRVCDAINRLGVLVSRCDDSDSDYEHDTIPESDPEYEYESESETESASETKTDSEPETESELEPESETETEPEVDPETESHIDAHNRYIDVVTAMTHISWNVCEPLSGALKYDMYNHELDSLTTDDYSEIVFEKTPKGYVTLIIKIGNKDKACVLQTPSSVEDIMLRLADFFHEPLDAEDMEVYKSERSIADDFDDTVLSRFELNLKINETPPDGLLQFCGLYRKDKYVYRVDIRRSSLSG